MKHLEVFSFCKDELLLSRDDVVCLQIDVSLNRFYVKCRTAATCDQLVSRNGGKYRLRQSDGEVRTVTVEHAAGLGTRLIRVFNLPHEMPDTVVSAAFSSYGKVVCVRREVWNHDFFQGIPNGVRLVTVELSKHVPSFVVVGKVGKVMTSYDGQPRTCAVCDKVDHTRQDCPTRAQRRRGWEKLPEKPIPVNTVTSPVTQSLGKPLPQRTAPPPPPSPVSLGSGPVPAAVPLGPASTPAVPAPPGLVPAAQPAVVHSPASSVDSVAALTPEFIAPVPSVSHNTGLSQAEQHTATLRDWNEEVESAGNVVQTTSLFAGGPPTVNDRKRSGGRLSDRSSKQHAGHTSDVEFDSGDDEY